MRTGDCCRGRPMMGHPLSDFLKFIGTDFERYILPIIPASARLSENSKLTEGQLGKIPGLWLPEERAWIGFKNWSNHYVYAKAWSLRHWQRWQTESGAVIPV